MKKSFNERVMENISVQKIEWTINQIGSAPLNSFPGCGEAGQNPMLQIMDWLDEDQFIGLATMRGLSILNYGQLSELLTLAHKETLKENGGQRVDPYMETMSRIFLRSYAKKRGGNTKKTQERGEGQNTSRDFGAAQTRCSYEERVEKYRELKNTENALGHFLSITGEEWINGACDLMEEKPSLKEYAGQIRSRFEKIKEEVAGIESTSIRMILQFIGVKDSQIRIPTMSDQKKNILKNNLASLFLMQSFCCFREENGIDYYSILRYAEESRENRG